MRTEVSVIRVGARTLAVLAAVSATACRPAAETAPAETPARPAGVVVAPPAASGPPPRATTNAGSRVGLVLGAGSVSAIDLESGSTRHAEFGLAKDAAVALISAAYAPPREEGPLDECGEGPLQFVAFGRGLTAYFQDGELSGWSARDDPSLSTMTGVRIGLSRVALRVAAPDARVRETTLGPEFEAEGVSGLLDGEGDEARVAALWDGTACVFR